MTQKLTTAMLRIRCTGNTHTQCRQMRDKAFCKTKNHLVDLYIVKDKRRNDGYCMVANATGTTKKFQQIRADFLNIGMKLKGKNVLIDDVEILEDI